MGSKRNTIASGLDYYQLPIHSLEGNSIQIQILPLDHTNPYDFKREHRHSYYEVILVEQGGCNQLIDFIHYPGLDLSCYMVCPGQIHLMNRNGATGTVLQFTEERIQSPEILSALRQLPFYADSAIIFENRQDLYDEFSFFLHLLNRQLTQNQEQNSLSVTHLLLAFLSLVVEGRQTTDKEPDQDKKLLIRFYHLLDQHFAENAGVRFFIESLGTTEKKLAQLTKKHFGASPLQVIHNRILLEAKRLLLFEDNSHKEIAYQLGFDAPASFSAFIKSKTGYSPTELAKKLAEIHK